MVDAYYGYTGWAGLGQYCWHCDHLHSRLNHTYINGGDRAIACQEIGHNIGLDHAPSGDCMAYYYYYPSSPYVEQHSIDDVRYVYAHVFGY